MGGGSLAASAAVTLTRSAGGRLGLRMIAVIATTVGLSFVITASIAVVDRQVMASWINAG